MAMVATSFGGYELLRPLASGGMAEVWLARWRRWEAERMVVIKRILPQYADDREFTDMFLQEVRLTALLRHPNVVQIVDAGEVQGSPYLVLEWVPGVSLRHVLVAGGALAQTAAVALAIDIAKALTAAHEHDPPIVHRDVNPHNILIDCEGFCKLADFGIAKAIGFASRTQAGVLKGKLSYLAPEQIERGETTPASDQYALALTLYEALTGQRALEGKSDVELIAAARSGAWSRTAPAWQAVDAELRDIIERALALDPKDRWPNLRALRRRLESFQARYAPPGVDAAELLATRVQAAMPQLDTAANPATATCTVAMPAVASRAMAAPKRRHHWRGAGKQLRRGRAVVWALFVVALAPIAWRQVEQYHSPHQVLPDKHEEPLSVPLAPQPMPPPAMPESMPESEPPPKSPPKAEAPAEMQRAANQSAEVTPPRAVASQGHNVGPSPQTESVATGTLRVQVLPWAQVRLNGRDIGTTPIAATEVAVGVHTVELVHPPSGWRRALTIAVDDRRPALILEAVDQP